MLAVLGGGIIQISKSAYDFIRILQQLMTMLVARPFRGQEILKQIHFFAYQSAPVVLFCLCFAAVVTIIESSYHMKLVIQNDALVPGFSALLIIRELGAVITALLLTSRVGAGIAAEVGTMKVTEQIDALKMLGINPIQFLLVPRFIAGVVSGILLTIIANMVCLYVAMLVSQIKLGYTAGSFIAAMRTFVEFKDLFFASIKGLCFGAIIPVVSCFYGLNCKPGAEGVGRATTNSVVASSVLIIITDFVLSWILSNFYS